MHPFHGHTRHTVFSLFRTENCGVFCVFHTVFFPPRQDTNAGNVHRESAHKRCFVTVKSVFINRYTASLYRIPTATKL
jgi:hypothetical protein